MNTILRILTGILLALPVIYALPASAQQSGTAAQTAPVAAPIVIAQKALTPEQIAKRKAKKAKRKAKKQGGKPPKAAKAKLRKAGANKPGKKAAARKAAQQKKIQQRKAKKQRAIKKKKARPPKPNPNLAREQQLYNQKSPSAARQRQLRNLDAAKQRRQQRKNAKIRKQRRKQQAVKQRRKIQTRKIKRNNAAAKQAQQRRNALQKQINIKRNRNARLKRQNNRLARQRNWLQAQRRNDRRTFRRNFGWRERARVVDRRRDRTIFTALAGAAVGAAIVGSYYVYHNDHDRIESWRARDAYVDDLDNGWTRNVVIRPNGTRVVTIRDVDGFIVRRYRVYPGNRIVMLYDNRPRWWDEGDLAVEVAPVRYSGPRSSYIIEPSEASVDDVYDAVVADPVDDIDRTYTLNQILVNRNLRDYMPRIDLDSINFASGSAEIPDSELDRLDQVGAAMEAAIKENPDEVYLIEGHTDATGDEQENLILSDERATAVANALTQYYDIPPENLVTQGYGEQFLKVETRGPEQRNRRVAIRRITPLLANESDDIALDSEGNEIFEKQ